jgi:hypothetical protein
MKRVQLVELHELTWFPPVLRDLLTDVMSYFAEGFRPYNPVAEKLWTAMQASGARSILDLCSGAGKSALTVVKEFATLHGVQVDVVLTDKFPNLAAFRRAVHGSPERVTAIEAPVDAGRVPDRLDGFRTLFTSFHHFEEDAARGILADAVCQRRGIGVFEYTERNFLIWGPAIVAMPLFVWLATPFIRPFSWRRVLWTNLVPAVPLLAAWDALVSCLRTYSPAELLALTPAPAPAGYAWEAGRIRSLGGCRITYLLGWPTSSRA